MTNFLTLASSTAASSTGDPTQSTLIMIVIYAAFIGLLYLIFFRPQQKKKKNEEKMRKSVQIGDEITTIGGIVGRVVGIKEDTESLIIETGSDRSKMRIKRWAVGSVDTIHDDAE
ncbi:MAG TPA: preprotein translocase subunit YajC [Oscillospiraceae bacterium]|nr:preprotein translocase subunit YajC [Oscillospiraceae bacterium]